MSLFDSLQTAIRGNKTTLHLGAFGKHPGWDDHLEDFGLETETLLAVKQLLYVQGIGGAIDSGAWEKLAPGELFPDFKHTFVWKTGRELIAGRMWSSTDRKGRARYPMIVCVHTSSNFPAANLLPWLFPALARMERSCQATREATEVVAILTRERETLRRQLEEIGDIAPPSAKPVSPQCSEEEWLRIVYSAESLLEPFGPDKISKAAIGLTRRSANASIECQHLRLPIPTVPSGSDAGVFSFWFDFLAPWIAPEAA